MTALHAITTSEASFNIRLPMTARSVPLARSVLEAAMSKWDVDSGTRDDVLLVVGELTANAVTHARALPDSHWKLVVVPNAEVIRIEVSDADAERHPELSPPSDGDQGDAERGRGLEMVDVLSGGAWGVAERPVGKTVWAQIKRPAPLGAS
ncbi:ATP-binding protein [Streptomyces sp. 35G-GA-8]|uniref:ATP-binding protein n=1 Tax=Streptomyces sp. 35G-GA-8 TaxID=2939434 RepID=UPI00201EC8FA|nr:ATP-binding protein [Streptomyces sp. 35G-GA-8]MCL7379629.1 ATP-binding protein [Streptomyces sp. 35G-GA-8]